MKDTDYNKLLEFIHSNGVLVPSNQNAIDLLCLSKNGESLLLQNVTARDLSFHKNYFAFLNFVWCAMPANFRANVPCSEFYKFIKHLKKEYKVIFTFKDGAEMIEYDSISFGKMNQSDFKLYVAEQIPFIYDMISQVYKSEDKANMVIELIEKEYDKFLAKLA